MTLRAVSALATMAAAPAGALTKTGGDGPEGLSIVKHHAATTAGTNDPARPAMVNVF